MDTMGKIKVNKSQTRCHSFVNHSGKIKARTKLCRQSCTYPLLLLSICMYENFTEQIQSFLSHTHSHSSFLLPSVLFLSYLQFLLLLYFPTTFSHNVVLSLIILILINTTGLQCIYFVVWTDRVCSVSILKQALQFLNISYHKIHVQSIYLQLLKMNNKNLEISLTENFNSFYKSRPETKNYRHFQLTKVLFLRPSKRQKCKLFDFVCAHSFTHYSMSSIYHTAWRNLVVSIFFIRFLILFAMKHGVTLYHFPFYKRIEYLNMEH